MNSTKKTGVRCTLLSLVWLICLLNCLHNSLSQHWHKSANGSLHHHHHNHDKSQSNADNLLKLANLFLASSHKHDDSSHKHSEYETKQTDTKHSDSQHSDRGQTDCCETDLRLNSYNLTSSQTLVFYSSYYIALMLANSIESAGKLIKKIWLPETSKYILADFSNLLLSLSVAANSPPA